MSERLLKIYQLILSGCGALAAAVFSLMAVLISLDVVLRNLGISNLPWLLEICEYALYGATFIAAPWVLSLGSHVRVDLVVSWLPAAVARLVEAAADLIGLAISATLGWYGFRVASDSLSRGDLIIKELAVPEWLLLAVMPLACLLLCTEFFRRFWRATTGKELAQERPEGL